MIIALDYDGTYTADPDLWDKFIENAQFNGHKIICLTMRYPKEPPVKLSSKVGVEIIYTSRQAKKRFADENGIVVDIWIDDKPAWLFEDALH